MTLVCYDLMEKSYVTALFLPKSNDAAYHSTE